MERNIGEWLSRIRGRWENKAIPVAIDTAGNTDRSVYSNNRFTGINGKCIDLDGFHHGEVTGNVCVNQRNFGIVMNNTNPDMQSEGITIADNTIDGGLYGGIFVIGTGNKLPQQATESGPSHPPGRTCCEHLPGAQPSPAVAREIHRQCDFPVFGQYTPRIEVSLTENKVERNQ